MMKSSSDANVAVDVAESTFARGYGQDLSVIEDLMASGQMLPSQLPSSSDWTPERKLAAAVLASALVEIRDHGLNPAYRRKIAEDLEWFASEDVEWPFSFLRLCDLFDLEPAWVRQVIAGWLAKPLDKTNRPTTPYRHAA